MSGKPNDKVAKTMRDRHGSDIYSKISKLGAEKYRERMAQGIAKPRGFALDRERASRAGVIGGTNSRRGPAKK